MQPPVDRLPADRGRDRTLRDHHAGDLRGRVPGRPMVAGPDARGAGGPGGRADRRAPRPDGLHARRRDGHGGGPLRRPPRHGPRRGERHRQGLSGGGLHAGAAGGRAARAAPRIPPAADRDQRPAADAGRHPAIDRAARGDVGDRRAGRAQRVLLRPDVVAGRIGDGRRQHQPVAGRGGRLQPRPRDDPAAAARRIGPVAGDGRLRRRPRPGDAAS